MAQSRHFLNDRAGVFAVGWPEASKVLRHMARLRRVSPASVQPVVEQLLRMVDLEEAADRYVAAYSSGLRARLSLALALVGAPPVLLLDKPTAHLDPIARRRAWHCVLTFAKKTHAAVLLATDE
ncbi:hypothetical protein HPB48_001431 [Haemaphysalis longicornis]|uniref:ABC transporter domain-containing protein n=1 Tax=Haemaphysalis longicornis TaxID=44386 RepID=A0A9J6GCU3_HAELO|nr:hypothetical protein HPB48_001431 [Haemaphysalis longicornis]